MPDFGWSAGHGSKQSRRAYIVMCTCMMGRTSQNLRRRQESTERPEDRTSDVLLPARQKRFAPIPTGLMRSGASFHARRSRPKSDPTTTTTNRPTATRASASSAIVATPAASSTSKRQHQHFSSSAGKYVRARERAGMCCGAVRSGQRAPLYWASCPRSIGRAIAWIRASAVGSCCSCWC